MSMRPAQRLLGCAILVLGVGLLAGCSGGSASGGGNTIQMTGTEFKYDPATVSVKAGSPVTVALKNTGTTPHDFTIDSLDGKKVQTTAAVGQTANVTFTPAAAGTYQFYCAQPGHKEGGMVGTLTVTA